SISRRSRLFATTSSRPSGRGATASPDIASVACSPLTMRTLLPAVWTSPSETASSSAAARGSPSATSAAIAALRSSASPNASFSTAALSSAAPGAATDSSNRNKRLLIRKEGRRTGPLFYHIAAGLLLLFRHQGRLVLLLVVARDERAPGL